MPPKSNKTSKTSKPNKTSKKKSSAAKTSARKRKNSQKKKTFNSYIVKVLKQVHPGQSVGEKEGVPMVNSMLDVVMKKIARVVSILLKRTGKTTVTSRDIQSAVRLTFPGELAKHAVSEGTKAITRYNATQVSGGGVNDKKPPRVEEGKHSKAFRAGLQFSVSRTAKIFYPNIAGLNVRKGAGAAIYLAAVLEYICAEILELSGNVARDFKKNSIKPRHIIVAVRGDEELDTMFHNTIMQGGVIPHIHKSLIKKSNKAGEAEY